MADILTFELAFSQQVAVEALKPSETLIRCRTPDGNIGSGLVLLGRNQILASRESRENGYVKRKAVDHPTRHQYLRCSRLQIIL